MDVEIQEEENGTRLNIFTRKDLALILDTDTGERIFLPQSSESSSAYYEENNEQLVPIESGYTLFYEGSVKNVKVVS